MESFGGSGGPTVDILLILQELQALLSSQAKQTSQVLRAISDLSSWVHLGFEEIDSRFDQIEAELNPPFGFIPPLVYWSTTEMAFVTTINLVAGSIAPDNIQCQDSSPTPQTFPGSQIVWAPMSGVGVVLDADGVTFHFMAPSTTPAGTFDTQATWTDPTGVQAPIVGPALTVNVTAVVVPPPPFVAPMQYNETAGA